MNAKGQCNNRQCAQCRNSWADVTDVVPLADAVKAELRKAATIRRDPFSHLPATLKVSVHNGQEHRTFGKDWLKPEPKISLSAVAGRLKWTTQPVSVGTYGHDDYETWANCTAWLKARREALGLSNDLEAPETTPEAPVTVSEAPRTPSAIIAELQCEAPTTPDRIAFLDVEYVNLTQADYAALLSMTGDMFQAVEPYGWYESGRNALLVHLAPALMPSSQNAMSLAEYESLAA